MIKELLITFNDFSAYKDISRNIDKNKDLEPYILQAQRMDLEPLLGNAFYLDVFTKTLYPVGSPATNEYDDLVNGVTYSDGTNTIQYYGLKPIIIYYSYARFIDNNDFRVTKYGNRIKENEFSSNAGSQTQRHVNNARSSAKYYVDNLINYLCKNSTSYPLWKGINNASKKGSVSIRSSSGERKYLNQGDSARYDIDSNT
jgi:hypothetical protein